MIITAAGDIWKMMGNDQNSCEILYFQMCKYKLKLRSYKGEFNSLNETPAMWWLFTDNTKSHLQELALYIFSVTPHNASCEQVFSTLEWLYGKRKLCLQIVKVKSMAKIRSFYISKVNDELKYVSSKYSKNELKVMINESLNNLEKDFKEDEPERKIVKQHKIPTYMVSNVNINRKYI